MGYELSFEFEIGGSGKVVGIDKVGGGTIGETYYSENWMVYIQNGDGEIREKEVFLSGWNSHSDAFKHVLDNPEDFRSADIYAENVKRGAEVLDELFSYRQVWRDKLATVWDDVDIADGSKCIIATLLTSYSVGGEILERMTEYNGNANHYGFDSDSDHDRMKEAWAELLHL